MAKRGCASLMFCLQRPMQKWTAGQTAPPPVPAPEVPLLHLPPYAALRPSCRLASTCPPPPLSSAAYQLIIVGPWRALTGRGRPANRTASRVLWQRPWQRSSCLAGAPSHAPPSGAGICRYELLSVRLRFHGVCTSAQEHLHYHRHCQSTHSPACCANAPLILPWPHILRWRSPCWSLLALACRASAATQPPARPGWRGRCSCASTPTTASEGAAVPALLLYQIMHPATHSMWAQEPEVCA